MELLPRVDAILERAQPALARCNAISDEIPKDDEAPWVVPDGYTKNAPGIAYKLLPEVRSAQTRGPARGLKAV